MTKWHALDIDEKLKKYDEFASHELNVFLFFKDRAYFDSYVRPFLNNKIEKTFVDYFLLGDHEGIMKHSSLEKITKLNAMEKILLLIHFLTIKKKEEASSIALFLENENKTFSYDKKTFKKYFDTILGSKSIENTEIQASLTSAHRPIAQQQLHSNMRNAAPPPAMACMARNMAPMNQQFNLLEEKSMKMENVSRSFGVQKRKMMAMKQESEEEECDEGGFS